MVGIGKWRANVKSKFFTGSVDFEVIDNAGEYEFNIDLPDKFKGIDYKYFGIVEKGNTLKCKGTCSAFPKVTVNVKMKFDGDNADIKLTAPPFPISVKIKNAQKIHA